MSFKRRLSSTEIYEYYPTLDHYTMGSKQSTQATGQSFQNTTKRKRSNTQASHHTQQIPIQNEYKPNAAPRMPSSV
jgi:hypothetical protein